MPGAWWTNWRSGSMSSRERRRRIQDEESLLSANPNALDP